MIKYWQKIGKARVAYEGHLWPVSIVLVAVFFWLGTLGANAAGFSATVDRNTVSTGESVTLSVKCDGADADGNIDIPNVPGLSFSQPGRSEQQSFAFINGHQESSHIVEYQYAVTASKPGTYTIPPITAMIEGKQYATQPITLIVGAAAKANPGQSGVFLKVNVMRTNVFVGEVVPVEVHVYYRIAQDEFALHLGEEGFTLGKIVKTGQSSTVVNGMQYNVATVRTYVVPVRAGPLSLGPASVEIQVPRSNARNIFNQLVDWHQITVESEPLTLNSMPVPQEGRPASYTGAVGKYSVSLTASPTNIAVGDPITLKVAVTGQGALDQLTISTPENWQHFKVYPPTSDFQPTDHFGTAGTKTFSLTVVPDSMEVKEVPPFEFSYFDPESRGFRSELSAAIPLTIRPSAASLPIQTMATSEPSPSAQVTGDIAPIKIRLGKIGGNGVALMFQKWFLASQSLPWLIAAAALVYRTRRNSLENNPRLLRRRAVEQLVRSGLAELKNAAAANKSEAFFGTLFHLLQEQIGDLLDVPPVGITEAVIEEKLRPAGVDADTIEKLLGLFHACNAARYSKGSSPAELNSLVEQFEEVTGRLKASIK